MTDVATMPERAPGRERTCVGCGEKVPRPAKGFVRLVTLDAPGPSTPRERTVRIAVDAAGGAFGRGAWVHASAACVENAARGGLARAVKGRPVLDDEPVSAATLGAAIAAAHDRRAAGLLQAAARSREVAIGADAVKGACGRGEAALVVVARDAAAAADLTEVRRAVAEGRAVAWADKATLGELVGKSGASPHDAARGGDAGVAVVAVTQVSLAAALRDAVVVSDSVGGMSHAPRSGGSVGVRRTRSRSG